MSEFVLRDAQRSQARLRLALAAVSGGGKTMSALRLARGIVEYYIAMGLATPGLEGKIALIDTERNSAQLYADIVPYKHVAFSPPYSIDRYNQALHAVEQAGILVCIIDQISHAWAGPGGQLEWVDTLKAGGAKHISPWATVTPVQQDWYDRMLRSPMHLIVTMRSKSEYVLEEVLVDGRKKTVPRKIGLSPVQREGIEYEFTSCLDIELDSHMATSTKDRTRLFDGRSVKLDEEVGRTLAAWLLEGTASTIGAPASESATPTQAPAPTLASAGSALGDERTPIEKLEDATADAELAFVEVKTAPDLAAVFDKAQKTVRGFIATLGAPTVKPFLDRVVKAKDTRKAALLAPTSTEPTPTGGAPEMGAGVGGQASPASGPVQGDLEDPDDGDLGKKFDLDPRVSEHDAGELAAIAAAQGLTTEEALDALGFVRYDLVPLKLFAAAVEKLKLAGAQKVERAEQASKGQRRRGAAKATV